MIFLVINRAEWVWQNANDENFNGNLRDECLSVECFRSRAEAKVVIKTWRRRFSPSGRTATRTT